MSDKTCEAPEAVRRLSLDEFLAELKGQGVGQPPYVVFKCPICGTLQNAQDLVAAGAGPGFDAVEPYLGFSCIGRWLGGATDFGSKPGTGRGCDYTLGGLIHMPGVIVIDSEGKEHMRFAPASPEEAQAYVAAQKAAAGGGA